MVIPPFFDALIVPHRRGQIKGNDGLTSVCGKMYNEDSYFDGKGNTEMKKKCLLAGALSAALLLGGCGSVPGLGGVQNSGADQGEAGGLFQDESEEKESGEEEAAEEKSEGEETAAEAEEAFAGIPSCAAGDIIVFGSYEQDNDEENGEEGIQWLVLDTEGENALLISRYGLDAQPYGDSGEAVTWENSALRRWLQGTFCQSAFSEAEREAIVPVTNANPDNARYGTEGGNDTVDTVFALSIEEAEAYFPDRDDNLWAEATPYAAEQGAYVADNGFSPWWLRSPGDHNEGGFCAAYVDYPPVGVSIGGYAAERDSRAVRPALWVKTQAGAGNGAGADASAGDTAASAGGTAVSDLPGTAVRTEDCVLRLIDCHPIQDGGETFTYLAFALLGPEDIGFHLEDGISETAEAWLVTNHQPGGWRVVTCEELPAGVTLASLSLSVTDYGSPEEKTVLLSDWGEPMSSEELRAVGVYEIEGHLALVGGGRTVKSSSQYGFNVGLGLIGGEVQKPGANFPILEHAAQLFQFYAADGTPLAESMGKEMEFFMDPGTLKVRFALADGTDADQEIARLKELAPYMVYTGGDGEVLSFPLNLDD